MSTAVRDDKHSQSRRRRKPWILYLLFGLGAAAFLYNLLPPSSSRWRKAATLDPVEPGRLYLGVSTRAKGEGGPTDDTGAVYAVDVQRTSWRSVHDSPVSSFRVAPDGKKIAYLKDKTVWVQEFDGAPKRVADLEGAPVWGPDGDQIILSAGELIRDDSPGGRQKFETWLMKSDGTGWKKLPLSDEEFVRDWSSDGVWLVTSSTSRLSRGQLFIVHPDGSHRKQITTGPGSYERARFAPGSNRLLCNHSNGLTWSIWVMEHDGSNPRKLMEPDANFMVDACWAGGDEEVAVVTNDFNPRGPRAWVDLMRVDGSNRRPLRLPSALSIGTPDWR